MTKSARRFPSDEAHRIKLRLPAGLRASIGQAARQVGRSMTAEMQQRIRRCPAPSPTADVNVGRTSEQFLLRLAEGMHEQLVAAARSSGRSLNSEIVLRLLSDTTQNTADTQEPSMARTDPTVYMKLPADLKASIEAAAAANRRSTTAEIVHRLTSSEEQPPSTDRHQATAYPLRLPPEVKAQVEASAKRTGRSLNAEITAQLRGAPNVADLRDRFALEAMKLIGTLASQRLHDLPADVAAATGIAIEAYKLADAMLRAREGGCA